MLLPLKQYPNQLANGPLWKKIHDPLTLQLEIKIWYKLYNRLWIELQKESPQSMLIEELEDKCSR